MLVLPVGHVEHESAAGPEYVPGRQLVHTVSPATAYEPGSHAEHTSDAPAPLVV